MFKVCGRFKSHNQLSPNGVFTNKCDVCRKCHCHTIVIGVILVQKKTATSKVTVLEVSWLIAAVPNLFLLAYPQAVKIQITYPRPPKLEGILGHFQCKYYCKS